MNSGRSCSMTQGEQQSSKMAHPLSLRKAFRAYKGDFKKAFALEKRQSGKALHLSNLKPSDKLICDRSAAEDNAQIDSAPIEASGQTSPVLKASPIQGTPSLAKMPLHLQQTESVLPPSQGAGKVSFGTQTSNSSAHLLGVRRSRPLSIFQSPQTGRPLGVACGTTATLVEPLKLQLLLEYLSATQPIESTTPPLSPQTSLSPLFNHDSRRDSGVGFSPGSETHKLKRAYWVLQQALQEQAERARKAEEQLENKKELISNALALSQRLQAEHDELKAKKAEGSATSASENNVLLKSRLEQRDRECSTLRNENKSLQTELTNTRYAKGIAECQVSELQGKHPHLDQACDSEAAAKITEHKTLYEKECIKSMQLRCALENHPEKTAELDKTVQHLRDSLEDCQLTNNELVKEIHELKKQMKSDQATAEAELGAAADQNEMLSDVAHGFCLRKTEVLRANEKAMDDMLDCNTDKDVAKAITYFVDTINKERRLEELIEAGATKFTEMNKWRHFYEDKCNKQEAQLKESKTDYQVLELQIKHYENKVTKLDVDVGHRWKKLNNESAAKDTVIQKLQDQKQQIEAHLVNGGLDGVAEWFLQSKNEEIETLHNKLAAAKQHIEVAEQELFAKGWFNRMDANDRAMEIEGLRTYPPRLEVAEKELADLRAKIEDLETQHNPQSWVDLRSHVQRVDEVRTQTRAGIIDQVRAEMEPQIKAETEHSVFKTWVEPLQTLGSFLWQRVARLEHPVVEAGYNVWDQERSILYQQSMRLRVSGADVTYAVSNDGAVGQVEQGYQVQASSSHAGGVWNQGSPNAQPGTGPVGAARGQQYSGYQTGANNGEATPVQNVRRPEKRVFKPRPSRLWG